MVEKVQENLPVKVYYMLHQAVMPTDRTITKLRAVLKASSHEKNGKSSNDNLLFDSYMKFHHVSLLLKSRLPRVSVSPT